MSGFHAVSIDEICHRGSIKDTDVGRLRRLVFTETGMSEAEAKLLFRINDACKVQDPSWAEFFIEAITDYVVNEAEPRGYITAELASWLMAEVSRDGRVDSKTELELLVTLLGRARWSPESLVRFTLDQVKHAVISGAGPLRSGTETAPGEIQEGEVELLRRILYAFGGDGNMSITRAEAEVLFEINDATADAPPNPDWTDLFVKAVANCVMGASGYTVPTREEALRREGWLESRGDLSIANIVAGMATGWLKAAYEEQTPEERALARLERQRIEIITNEEVTQGEVEWLADRLGRDGRLTENVRAALDFLLRESPKIHPALAATVERLGKAA